MRRTGGVAVAVGVVLLLDTLRIWLPSVIFVYGRAGSTPATEMAGFGLAPFLVTLVAAAALVLVRPTALALAGIVAMAGGRVAVQATSGGDPQLWLATIAVVGGLVWLIAVAGGAVAGSAAGQGLAVGLAADAGLHALLRSTGLAWRDGIGWWVVVLVLAAAAVMLAWQAADEPDPRPAAARGWLVVGPVLLLHALVAGVVSRAHAITGWPEPLAVGLVAGGWALGLGVAWWMLAGNRAGGSAGAALTLLGVVAALSDAVSLVAIGHVVLPVGLAVTVTAVLPAHGKAGAVRRGLLGAVGIVLLGVLVFLYYAAYDLVLGFPNDALLVVAALVVGAVAVTVRQPVPSARLRAPAAAAVAVALVAVTAAVALASETAEVEAGDGSPVRVVLYNLQMGFDIHGRQALDEQARVIADAEPDIVVLNEVSRGWLINAATDTLPRLADHLGLVWHFAPAADRVWGNALLSRYPVRDVRSELLPHEPVPMRRGYISAIVELGGGAELGIVGTHLTHVAEGADVRAAQIAMVVAEARRLAEGGRPVAVIGDLNAQPGDPELEALAEFLADVSEPHQPVASYPSWDPERLIDHIYVSPEVTATDYVVPQSTASDHLPVVVTLDVR